MFTLRIIQSTQLQKITVLFCFD